MEPIWQWGVDFIRAVQALGGPALDAVFKAITFIGEEQFFIVIFSLVLWCVDFAAGARLALAFLLSPYLNTVLKDLFAHPRPFELDPALKRLDIGGYGLPSGHAQNAVVLWGAIAAALRRAWLWVVVVLLVVLIGFSRVYLGVHFPTDVLGGWAIGAGLLAVYLALGSRVEAWLKRMSLAAQLALAVAVPLVLLLLHPADDAASSMAVMMGVGVGVALTSRVAPFSAAGPLWQRAARFLVGMAGVLAVYLGLKRVFPGVGEPFYFAMRVVRYALVGLWAGLGAPWLFRQLRLASGEARVQ